MKPAAEARLAALCAEERRPLRGVPASPAAAAVRERSTSDVPEAGLDTAGPERLLSRIAEARRGEGP